MPLQGGLSIERMCELARVSRASFYRSLKEQRPGEEETEVRSAIQQIALEHRRRYGYRRISAELRRRGMQVNHKRVLLAHWATGNCRKVYQTAVWSLSGRRSVTQSRSDWPR